MMISNRHAAGRIPGVSPRCTKQSTHHGTYIPNLVVFFAWTDGKMDENGYRVFDAVRACCSWYDIRDSGAAPSKAACMHWLDRNPPSSSHRVYLVISDSGADAVAIADQIDACGRVYILLVDFAESHQEEVAEVASVEVSDPNPRRIHLRLERRSRCSLATWVSLILHAEFSSARAAVETLDRNCRLASEGAHCLIAQTVLIDGGDSGVGVDRVGWMLTEVATAYAGRSLHIVAFYRVISGRLPEIDISEMVSSCIAASRVAYNSIELLPERSVWKVELALFILVL